MDDIDIQLLGKLRDHLIRRGIYQDDLPAHILALDLAVLAQSPGGLFEGEEIVGVNLPAIGNLWDYIDGIKFAGLVGKVIHRQEQGVHLGVLRARGDFRLR